MTDLPISERPLRMGPGRLVVERPAVIDKIRFRGSLNKIGAFSYGNEGVTIYNTDIGRYCSIAHDVMIAPVEHPVNSLSTHGFVFNDGGTFGYSSEYRAIVSGTANPANHLRTTIGNDVWIGCRAFIRRGVTIGDGAVVAAQATVVSDVEPYTIVGGTPARPIRRRFDEETIARLKSLAWWRFSLERERLGDIDFSNVPAALSKLECLVEAGALDLLEPQCVTFEGGKAI